MTLEKVITGKSINEKQQRPKTKNQGLLLASYFYPLKNNKPSFDLPQSERHLSLVIILFILF